MVRLHEESYDEQNEPDSTCCITDKEASETC